jgi:hypothetical protein
MSIVRIGILTFAAVNLALAFGLAFAPHAFFTDVGPYGAQNNHYMRDLATFYAALGIALLVADRVASWRVPVLFIAALQSGLHTINHLADVDAAHPRWLGPANLISLALATCLLVWLTRESLRPVEDQP